MASSFYIISLLWGITAIVLLPVAWVAARRKNVSVHWVVMCLLVLGGWGFVLYYLISNATRDTYPDISGYYLLWFAVHGLVGLLTLVVATALAGTRLYLGKNSFLNRNHKAVGTVTLIFWLLTLLGGILNLYLLG